MAKKPAAPAKPTKVSKPIPAAGPSGLTKVAPGGKKGK
jgi:hypothetical protein